MPRTHQEGSGREQVITGTEFLIALRKHNAEERRRMAPIEMAILIALMSKHGNDRDRRNAG